MLTNIVSQTSPGAGSLYIRASSSNVLTATRNPLLLNGRQNHQARAYRCGIWSSYFGPDIQRHSRRRQRMIKYKYAESQNRKSSWDQNPLADDTKTALQRIVGKYWQAGALLCGGSRMVSYDAGPSQPYKEGNQKDGTHKNTSTKITPLGDVLHRWTQQSSPWVKRAASRLGTSTAEASAGTPLEDDFIIDPITNRKVVRKTYRAVQPDAGAPAESFKSSWSRASRPPGGRAYGSTRYPPTAYGPTHSPPPISRAELKRYEEVGIDPLSAAPYQRLGPTAIHKQQPGSQSEEYSLNHLPPEDQAEVYDDLHKYNASEHDEIKDIAEEAAPKYDDLHNYKPTEPDEIDPPSAEPIQAYDDLHEYKPTEHDEIKYEPDQPVQKYNDLHNYRLKGIMGHDETTASTSQSAPKYDDLGDYKPFRYNESDATQSEPNPVYDDLHKYRPYMYSENAPATDEVAAPKYEDLDKYKSHTDVAGNDADPAKPQYEDLDKYQPFLHQEGQSETKQGSQYEDLDKYRSDVLKEPESAEGQPFEQYGDLDQYKAAYRFQEPDGKAPEVRDEVEQSLGEFDVNKENRENLEQAMTGYIAVSDAIDKEVSAGLQRSRQRAMENQPSINIFRDPPEKFQELLREHNVLNDLRGARQDFNSPVEPALGRMNAAPGNPSEGQSKSPVSRHQQTEADTDDSCSKVAAETIETANKDGHDAEQAQDKKYGDLDPENPVTIPPRSPPSTPPSGVEPTIYKILAYDPTMQSVSIAETSSIVPDQAAPLTPSEVLVRMSNPTKFFPHFEPLRAEGFEIVSGSGDVLVFRKVRETASSPSPPSSSTTTSSSSSSASLYSSESTNATTAPPVNPIDMMGRQPLPNAAAFASPTGFVNYNDSSFIEETPRPPPFRSQINVRREEPVFSGPKVYVDRRKKKKTSLTKRIFVGGAWVAGGFVRVGGRG
ncbi:c3hc4 type (ring finger) zinc finger containing protein [Apiospora saccharicola]